MFTQKRKSLVIASLLTMSLVATACGSSGPATSSNTPTASPSATATAATTKAASEENLEVSVGFWDVDKALANRGSDDMLTKMEKDFNITFKPYTYSWSDYSEKLKLWGASGELPDIFSTDMVGSSTYNQWIEQELIRPLPDDLSAYPNVQKLMQRPDVKALQKNGSFYMLPRSSGPSTDAWLFDRAILVRKDWMDKLGIKEPKSFQEYEAMFKSFAEKDPDGNGKKDTVGLTVKLPGFIDTLFLGSNPAYMNGAWVNEDGKWLPSVASKTMIDGVSQLKQLYVDGALDPDFSILKNLDGWEKFAQGKAGAIASQVTPNALNDIKKLWEKYEHDKSFEDSIAILPVWTDKDGNAYRFTGAAFWSESYFSAKVDDAKMDRILKLYDYLLSDDGRKLVDYGFEGKDFKMDGTNLVVTLGKDEKTGGNKALGDIYPSTGLFGSLASWYDSFNAPLSVQIEQFGEKIVMISNEKKDEWLKSLKPIPTNYDVMFLSTPAKDKISAIPFNDDIIKVILSKGDVQVDWNKVIEDYNSKGLQTAIDEVNAQMNK
ncbi:putative aldouronate transport system substrate-binding protein [Paenibacillus castaneae]|uniref:extracellular solute-binding protein n=1 Tax=Paenibacillus castaneae TaxID=474957 RepID=UPI00141B3A86|nr:extracellular solute-binding protein [Paenibacillus castaneae]NIK78720.1 putative aldouronate transport system substrate-binding protein [Paenibacillus castaneae]